MSARLSLFGSPTIDRDGEALVLPFERRGQLLAFLALRRAWVGRADSRRCSGRSRDPPRLHQPAQVLFRMQSPAWTGWSSRRAARCAAAETDVEAFEAALRERRLAEALALRRGELLPGFDDDASEAWSSWLAFERERLRSAWRERAAPLEAGIEPREAIELSAALLEADPLDESALRAHMAWLARAATARARPRYREFDGRLAEGARASLRRRSCRPARRSRAAGRRARRARPADDGFVGRSVELRQIAALLAQPDCRLVCLVGPGGVGKTRLARRAIAELAGSHADGSAFVALEDARTGADVVSAISREVGVARADRGDPLGQLVDFLRGRQVLLALDNFEQLAAEAPIVERLLKECPKAHGDRHVARAHRPLHGAAAAAGGNALARRGGPGPFRLVRRGAPVRQGRAPHRAGARARGEAAAIVDICRQVEGLPLAHRAGRGLDARAVLRGDRRAASRGHELLRASTPRSRRATRASRWSSTSRGGCSRRSTRRARAPLGLPRRLRPEAARAAGIALPVLGALADKSLVRKDGPRIHMHPLVQQMAHCASRTARRVPPPRPRTRAISTRSSRNCAARWRPATASAAADRCRDGQLPRRVALGRGARGRRPAREKRARRCCTSATTAAASRKGSP
jgi:DNA-binding SARP family transcriptional activator